MIEMSRRTRTLRRSRRIWYAVAGALPLTLAALAVAAGSAAASPAASTNVTVTVSAASSGSVGAGFAGFSYEKDRVGADVFNASDTNLVNLFKLLGPSVLRIGGNLVDIVKWNPSGSGGSPSEVAPPDVTKLAGFLKATGWKAIYGINLKTNTPANAANEAQFVANALGSSLLSFSIGNEPEFYVSSESAYEADFNSYVSAIRAKVPNAVFDGPEVEGSGATSWYGPFAADEKNNHLTILSFHDYIGNNTSASIPGMLASNPSAFAGAESAVEAAMKASGIPQWRMTEANSYYHGGADGVSNVKAAALWALDFMDGIAAHGGAGVNFHGGTSVQFPLYYTPITFINNSGITPTGVQGVYYGELLWKLAGAGALHTATVSGESDVTAWGISNNVIVNNKSDATLATNVTLPAAASTAGGYVLTGHALNSPMITIAGSAVSVSGSFSPHPQSLTVSGKTVSLTIPPHSATLVVTH